MSALSLLAYGTFRQSTYTATMKSRIVIEFVEGRVRFGLTVVDRIFLKVRYESENNETYINNETHASTYNLVIIQSWSRSMTQVVQCLHLLLGRYTIHYDDIAP